PHIDPSIASCAVFFCCSRRLPPGPPRSPYATRFRSRVIAGTGSDMHSCITGAIGALRGPKHGGANEVAMDIISRYGSAEEAEARSEEHTSELQSRENLVCRLLLEKKKHIQVIDVQML